MILNENLKLRCKQLDKEKDFYIGTQKVSCEEFVIILCSGECLPDTDVSWRYKE